MPHSLRTGSTRRRGLRATPDYRIGSPISSASNFLPSRPSVVGYASGATAASLIYVAWIAFVVSDIGPQTSRAGFGFRLSFAIFFWVADGFAATLLLMVLPWILAVSIFRKLRWAPQLYFPGAGAFVLLVLACASSSLAPKPLFVDDQTFLQGAIMAAQRQGIAYLLAGLAFGACYWFFGERHIPAREQQS